VPRKLTDWCQEVEKIGAEKIKKMGTRELTKL